MNLVVIARMVHRGESMNLMTISRRGNIGLYAAHTDANNTFILVAILRE